MKPKRKDGGPAFPLGDMEWNEANSHNNGMTLRDYFAGQALAGCLSAPLGKFPNQLNADQFAHDAYAFADAMIEARSTKEGSK